MRLEVIDYVVQHIAPFSVPGSPRFTGLCFCEGRHWYATNRLFAVEGDCLLEGDLTGAYRAVDIIDAARLRDPQMVGPVGQSDLAGLEWIQTRLNRRLRKPRRSSHDVSKLLRRCDRYPERISADSLLQRPSPHELDCGTYLSTPLVRRLLEASPEPRLSVRRREPLERVMFVGTAWRALLMPIDRSEAP